MLVILLPGTTLSDWIDDPTLHRLMGEGAVGLMNTRTARMPNDKHREPPDAAVLTLSAGARANSAGIEEFDTVFDYEAVALWRRRMGFLSNSAPLTTAAEIDPTWALVLNANRNLGYDVHPGNLVDALRAHGIMVTCRDGYPYFDSNRLGYAVLAAAGSDGHADVSAGDLAGLVFIDITLGQAERPGQRDEALEDELKIANFYHARVLILSPFVNDRAYAVDDRLAPVLMLGDGVPHGLLTSPSTRTPGLITNCDIAPTIAAYFGVILPTPAVGRPIDVNISSVDPLNRLRRLHSFAMDQRRSQKVLPYCAVALGLVLIVVAFLALRRIDHPKITGFASALVPALIVFLIFSPPRLVVIEIGVAVVMGLVVMSSNTPELFALKLAPRLLGIAAGIILLDAAFDGHFLRFSVLGYSPIEGARYYGIGNESMGALAGAMLIVIAQLWGRSRSISGAVIAAMLASIIIVGAPSMGAKAGGVIVLAGAFAVFLWSSSGRKLTLGGFAVAALLGIVLLGLMAIADSARSSTAQSHMGAAVDLIRHGGIGQAVDIIMRKLAVEIKLATHSTWALPVWAGLVCLVLQRRNAIADGLRSRIALADSTLVAAILMLLFNDAGAVACALCLSLVCSYLAVVDSAKPARETTSTASSEPVPSAS